MKHLSLIALLLAACNCTATFDTSLEVGAQACDVDQSISPASGFRTKDLTVDQTATIGSGLAAGGRPLTLTSSSGTMVPLSFTSLGARSWDLSPITVTEPTEASPSSITFFGNTTTSTPSNDKSLFVRLQAGTGGAAGIGFSPNGASYMDPDGYAYHGKILALGFMGAEYLLDVRDLDNARLSSQDCVSDGLDLSCRVANVVGNSHMTTGAGANTAYEAVHASALANRAAGSALVINYAVRASAKFGDQNWALVTDDGNVDLNRTTGTTRIRGATQLDGAQLWNASGNRFAAASGGLYNANFGAENDGTYILNGNLSSNWSVNGTEHLNISFIGYLGSTTQFRDTRFGDGKGVQIAEFNGAAQSLTVVGPTVSASFAQASGVTWKSGAGSPEGVVTAPVGSLYSRTNGGALTSLYVKESGTGNTGWVAK